MPRIYPELTAKQISEIPSSAEQIVYKALRDQTPDDWLIIHSLEFIMTNPHYESHMDREADFVIFAPEYGVLVVEVKGGGISYSKKSDQWHSINRRGEQFLIKNPLRQAKDAKYEIRRHLQQRMKSKKILIAHAALFPDFSTQDISALESPDCPIEILGTSENIINIKEWCLHILKYWSGKEPNFNPLETTGVEIASRIYGKEIELKPSLMVEIKRESDIQIELTTKQKEILRQLRRRKRAIIEGGAGTGKTILALDHAQNLAEQGSRVLLLCYNKMLGSFLSKKTKETTNLTAMAFHDFCEMQIGAVKKESGRDLLQEATITHPDQNKFGVQIPSALTESLELIDCEYDTIIVDEGQDFSDEFWLPLEMIADSNDARFYIFQDTNQAIYGNLSSLPIVGEPLTLFDNCRNTKQIHKLAYKYYDGIEINEPNLDGDDVNLISLDNCKSQATYLDKIIHNLISQDGVSPKDIAVVTIGHFADGKVELEKSKNSKIWAFQEFGSNNRVLVESAMRFKGLEAKFLFLWIIDKHNLSEKLLYVAVSRARLRLWIVGDEVDEIMESVT